MICSMHLKYSAGIIATRTLIALEASTAVFGLADASLVRATTDFFKGLREDKEIDALRHPRKGRHQPGTSSRRASTAKVLGWTFTFSMPVAAGEMHMFAYSPQGGGGVRPVNPPEVPGSVPYVHVASCADAFAKALDEGAEEMMPPTRVMEGVTVAIVRAPGGVPIGFSGP
jgi:predicted enzyme related to lactoylglutathione lyase